jgi:hypothetical protein
VVDAAGRPIKFDGLIGDAVVRETGTSVGAYTAISIQAHPALAPGAPVALGPAGSLVFDGLPGHYQAVTGVIYADVAFDRPPTPPVTGPRTTMLTLLTLDTKFNRPNYPTFVDLDFYNSSEQLLSTSTDFTCWQEVPLSGINNSVIGVPAPAPLGASAINTTLTGPNMGTRKGIVIGGPAEKVPIFGITDTAGPVTLLGLVEVLEGASPTSGADRQFFYQFLNDSTPVNPVARAVQAQLSDPREPGSVIVFPKFVRGFVPVPGDGAQPRTEFEVGVVCPQGQVCAEGQQVRIRFHYVCGF